jgi:hypothetical protein
LRVAGEGELYCEDIRDKFSNWEHSVVMSGSGEDSIVDPWGFITILRMALGFLLWNSFTLAEALLRFRFGSQESWASENPFHRTRYCNVFAFPVCLEASTLSTSHSSCPSIRSGGALGKLGPCSSVSLYGWRTAAWNALWILHAAGRSSLYVTALSTSVILKGPKRLALNFIVGCVVRRWVPSSQTF